MTRPHDTRDARDGVDIKEGALLHAHLDYPNDLYGGPNPRTCTGLEVNLSHVRAADPIRLTFDMDRDGWVVWQAKRLCWDVGDEDCDPLWTEAAFLPAWQHNEDPEL